MSGETWARSPGLPGDAGGWPVRAVAACSCDSGQGRWASHAWTPPGHARDAPSLWVSAAFSTRLSAWPSAWLIAAWVPVAADSGSRHPRSLARVALPRCVMIAARRSNAAAAIGLGVRGAVRSASMMFGIYSISRFTSRVCLDIWRKKDSPRTSPASGVCGIVIQDADRLSGLPTARPACTPLSRRVAGESASRPAATWRSLGPSSSRGPA